MLDLKTRDSYTTLLDAHSLQAGDDTALIYVATDAAPVVWSRTQWATSVAQKAGALQVLGIKPRDLVIIAYDQTLDGMSLFWGALQIGAIPSMLPPLTPKLDPDTYMEQMQQLVEHSGAAALVTTAELADILRGSVGCAVYSSEQLPSSAAATIASAVPTDIAFLQHSSGTTGLQKGIALSHEAVLNQLASYSHALNLQADDVIVSWLPLYHDMGLIAGFLLPLVQGIPLVIMSPFDWVKHPALLLRAINEYDGTFCWLPNFAYHHCARRIRKRDVEGVSLASMRAFINCSEPVSAASHRQFHDRFADQGARLDQFAVSYAMAENTFAVTQTTIGQPPHIDYVDSHRLDYDNRAQPVAPDAGGVVEVVSCGEPIAGVSVQVINDAGDVLPERHIGELRLRSDFMLSEYYHRPDLNANLFDAGWYATGDLGYIAGGQVYVIGRKKDLIINAGKNVYPQDIEAIVNAVDGVHPGRSVVFGVYDEREGTELIAVVAEADHDDVDEHELGKAIRQAVARESDVTVSYVKIVEQSWLIKTSSGKIARAANRKKWLESRA